MITKTIREMGTNLSESDFGDEVRSHDDKDVDSVLVDRLPVEAVTEEAPEQGRNYKCLNRGLDVVPDVLPGQLRFA